MDYQPGSSVTIVSDIVTNNQLVFQKGEQVVIESVSPNPQQPDYKYVVISRTGTRYQLREVDIVSQTNQAVYQPAYAPVPEKRGLPAWGVALIVVGSLVVVLGVLGAILLPAVFSSANANAQRRTCQANLRTIDGAINTYNAQYDSYPPAGEVGDILVPTLIRLNPTCPTSGETYVLEDGPDGVPTVSCPTNVAGHSI